MKGLFLHKQLMHSEFEDPLSGRGTSWTGLELAVEEPHAVNSMADVSFPK